MRGEGSGPSICQRCLIEVRICKELNLKAQIEKGTIHNYSLKIRVASIRAVEQCAFCGYVFWGSAAI